MRLGRCKIQGIVNNGRLSGVPTNTPGFKINKKENHMGIVYFLQALVIVVYVSVSAFATEYLFEFWMSFVKGVSVDLPFWVCAVAGFFIGALSIPGAIITWLLSFAM